MSKFQRLRNHPLLSNFSDDGVKIIQSIASEHKMRGQVIITQEKSHGESLFLLTEGKIEFYVTRDEEDLILSQIRSQTSFGEMSILHPGPRKISARTLGNCLLYEIPRRDFIKLQKKRPQTCMKLMLNIIRQFSDSASKNTHLFESILEQFEE